MTVEYWIKGLESNAQTVFTESGIGQSSFWRTEPKYLQSGVDTWGNIQESRIHCVSVSVTTSGGAVYGAKSFTFEFTITKAGTTPTTTTTTITTTPTDERQINGFGFLILLGSLIVMIYRRE